MTSLYSKKNKAVKTKKTSICFIGAGYVGLTWAAVLANLGNWVFLIEANQEKLDQLKLGQAPIYEPGLSSLVKKTVKKGQLLPTSDWQKPIKKSQIIFVAVGTPVGDKGQADLTQIKQVAKQIGQNFSGDKKIIVNKSTVPVGTAWLVEKLIKKENPNAKFEVVSCPEFLREGQAVTDTQKPSRVVIGTSSSWAFNQLKSLFLPLGAPIINTSRESAEIIKYAANSYLALRVGFIDQVALLCEKTGADVCQVIEGLGLDPRIGGHYWYPGIGYGGYCFPKDVAALAVTFKKTGLEKNLFSLLDQLNQERPALYAQKLADCLGENKTMAVLGLTAKPGTADMRGSQAVYFIEALVKKGIGVRVFDPMGIPEAKKILTGVSFCSSVEEAVKKADALAILCEWPEFKKIDWLKIKKRMRGRFIFDAKRMFDKKKLSSLGLKYWGVGI